jgi:hypothetical protein
MFVETTTALGEVWHRWTDRLRLLSEPPVALFASIAWDNGDGTITAVTVGATHRRRGHISLGAASSALLGFVRPR